MLFECSWSLGTSGNHSRDENNATALSWNYTINVQPGGISRVAVTAVQSSISTAYTGTLNLTLDSQYVLAIPVEGDFEGESTSPVVRCSPSCWLSDKSPLLDPQSF